MDESNADKAVSFYASVGIKTDREFLLAFEKRRPALEREMESYWESLRVQDYRLSDPDDWVK